MKLFGIELFSAGGLVCATGVSACCVVPLASVLAGVGGPWLGYFTPLASYQPYFVGASVLFLGLGFTKVYNKREKPCATSKSQRMVKTALWGGTALVLLSLIAQRFLPLVLET